jgi:hypothetical protein
VPTSRRDPELIICCQERGAPMPAMRDVFLLVLLCLLCPLGWCSYAPPNPRQQQRAAMKWTSNLAESIVQIPGWDNTHNSNSNSNNSNNSNNSTNSNNSILIVVFPGDYLYHLWFFWGVPSTYPTILPSPPLNISPQYMLHPSQVR